MQLLGANFGKSVIPILTTVFLLSAIPCSSAKAQEIDDDQQPIEEGLDISAIRAAGVAIPLFEKRVSKDNLRCFVMDVYEVSDGWIVAFVHKSTNDHIVGGPRPCGDGADYTVNHQFVVTRTRLSRD